jgi:hypothetical protein
VGKTAFTSLLVDWYAKQGAPYTLLDLDTENKARGSLAHFFPQARKVDIHTSEGLDAFVDALDDGEAVVIADMGAGAGGVTYRWFDSMYGSVAESGVAFTARHGDARSGQRGKRSGLGARVAASRAIPDRALSRCVEEELPGVTTAC